ncbi:MAG: hypothetical protein MI921_02955 [Cytophagales bacterium]|nr:hypothetical protein [Cytophagales bacterium]
MSIKIFFVLIVLPISPMVLAQDYTFVGGKYTVDAIDKKVEGKVYIGFYLDSK